MQGGAVFKGLSGRIVRAQLLTVALFGVIWGAVLLYSEAERERAEKLRIGCDILTIELLETRRAERDFLLKDVARPTFFQAPAPGSANVAVPGTRLADWEKHLALMNEEIKSLEALGRDVPGFDPQTFRRLRELSDQYAGRFRQLVELRHRMGFKDWGTEGEWRKAIHDLESELKTLGDPALNAKLLQTRRDEKDFLLRGEKRYVDSVKKDLEELRAGLKGVATSAALLERILAYEKAFDAYLELRTRAGMSEEEGLLRDAALAIDEFDSLDHQLMDAGIRFDEAALGRLHWRLAWGALGALVLAGGIGVFLGRRTAGPIAALAVSVQSAAAELQTAANQQATGTREQATSMQEISTTINELLASSRQIAESARRVAQIAENAGSAARAGDQTVQASRESIEGIRRQVDLIVNHMLDLGKKSQEIGGVLEIIHELAEQTNILSINATIEAAGGGEHGKRFGVVADEIRKLADRVGGSTKEIQTLVEQVRGAVNATVMATESGSKAVDAGARQFNDVASAFRQIAGLVGTNSEAGREIELTTKQQATAVEQVNSGVLGVGQATREMEASTAQTFQTATQLANVSRELAKLVDAAADGKA